MIALLEAEIKEKAIHKRFEECNCTEEPRRIFNDSQLCINISHDIDNSGRAKNI